MEYSHKIFPNYVSALLVAVAVYGFVALAISGASASELAGKLGFELSTEQGGITLQATNAPLKAIHDRIGQELDIKVDAQVADGDTVKDEFKGLPLDQALRRLAPSYAVVTDLKGGKISKIVMLPEGEATPTGQVQQRASKPSTGRDACMPEPFKFQVAPAHSMKKAQEGQRTNGATEVTGQTSQESAGQSDARNSGIQGTTSFVVVSGVPGGQTSGDPASIEFAIAPVADERPVYKETIFIKSDQQGTFKVTLPPGKYWLGSKAKALDPRHYDKRAHVTSFAEKVVLVREGAFTQVNLFEVYPAP